MKEKVLVVAAHPDDEILGCGGTMAKHVDHGDDVLVVIMAQGLTSRGASAKQKNELIKLKKDCVKAQKILGISNEPEFFDFPDNEMDKLTLIEIVKKLEVVIGKFKPTIVYTHHIGDVNVDHQLTHQAVFTACRSLPGSTVKRLLFFEVLSSTEWMPAGSAPSFSPNYFSDISDFIEKKMSALKAYDSEMRPFPHTRSYETVRALATLRGSTFGTKAGEAFMVGRFIC